MFNKISEVLQSATDVIAPPPTPLQDLEYHWRKVKNFYVKDAKEQQVHLENTTIPVHLNGMLEIIQNEGGTAVKSKEAATSKDSICEPSHWECLEFLISSRLLDRMTDLALADSPAGMKGAVLNWLRRFLTNVSHVNLADPSIYQPVLKLLSHFVQQPEAVVVSPYEREEVLFLVALTAAVLQSPETYLNLFVDTHYEFTLKCITKQTPQRNSLFDACIVEPKIILPTVPPTEGDLPDIPSPPPSPKFKCNCDSNGKYLPLSALVRYLNSVDYEIVIKACEGILIMASLDDSHLNCNSLVHSLENFIDSLAEKLCSAYANIPEDIDPMDIELEHFAWGLNFFEKTDEEREFVGKVPLLLFLSWLDYYDCIVRELKSEQLLKYATFKFHVDLLQRNVQEEVTDGLNSSKIMLLTKIFKQIHSPRLYKQCLNWILVDRGAVFSELLNNAIENRSIVVETLALVEIFVDRPDAEVLDCLIMSYLEKRAYFNHETIQSWSDEEDERERRRGSHEESVKSRTLAPNNILKVINNFQLLLPKQILGDCVGTEYEEYVQDASRHYRAWVQRTRGFEWPVEAVSPKRKATPERKTKVEGESGEKGTEAVASGNDSGIAEEVFYEGPLLRMLFYYVRNMVQQPYEVNLAVIAILSKLAFLPHPYLHEVLLNPQVPILAGVNTLWTALQETTRQILARVPLIEEFKRKIEKTGRRLLVPQGQGEESDQSEKEGEEEPDTLLESVIVLEEFAKELAAIAFVKFHYATE